MKIAIYGDSFGSETPIFETEHANLKKIGSSWVTLLRQHYDVENFCVSGSDYYFSFNNFLKNYKNYDINIFIETSCNRLTSKYKDTYIHNHSIASADAKLKNSRDTNLNKIYKACIDYFVYLHDSEKDETLTRLMRREIERLDKKCFFIKSFGQQGLFNITLKENAVWNVDPTYTQADDFLDLRYCHMTKENNEVLYKTILQTIKANDKFHYSLSAFVNPSIQDKDLYLVQK